MTHEREMPDGPEGREDETGHERRMILLQARQREAAPTRFFAQANEEEDKNETIGHLAPFVGNGKDQMRSGHEDCDRSRGKAKDKRKGKDKSIPTPADSSPNEPGKEVFQLSPAAGESGHDHGRDERSKRIWASRSALGQSDNPRIPREKVGETEEEQELVVSDP